MLDDVRLAFYDSNTRKIIYRSYTDVKYHEEDQCDANLVLDRMYQTMKIRAFYHKEHTNQTSGISVHQRFVDCVLLDDKPTKIQTLDAFNGVKEEDLTYDVILKKIHSKLKWVKEQDETAIHHLELRFENMYQPVCFKVLNRYLKMENSTVMRKVKPIARLFKKTLVDSERSRITCLATGFYPRHINLTILMNDEEPDEEMTEDLLPNQDQTYQIRKSLEINTEKLHEELNYSCVINHISLEKKIIITLDPDESDEGFFTLIRVIIVLLCVTAVVVLIITGFIIYKKMKNNHASVPTTEIANIIEQHYG